MVSALRSDFITPGSGHGVLKLGNCIGAHGGPGGDPSKMWEHLAGSLTGSPSIPGFQLINHSSAAYVTDFNLCFANPACPQTYDALLFAAGVIFVDPAEFGGAAKWRYRFAVSATP